jgi:hypothetical protein
MRSDLVAFASLAFVLTGCGGAYGSLGMAEGGTETGEGGEGGEGTGESGTIPPDMGEEGGMSETCLPRNGDGIGGPGYGQPVDAAFSPVPGQAYVLTRSDGFAQVVHTSFDPWAKLAVLGGWDLSPGGIEVGADGSVFVGATLERDAQDGLEHRQWATRMTADLVPVWRTQIHPYSPDQNAWADGAVLVDDRLWLIGTVEDLDDASKRTTVTIVDTEGEVVDAVEIEFPLSAHMVDTRVNAVWTDGEEVVVGGVMQASADGQDWEDGWLASLSAQAAVDWIATPTPIVTDLTATADRLWVVEGETLHELDREANPIAQHPLSGPGVGIGVFDDHVLAATSIETKCTVDCVDLQGKLVNSEWATPPDLKTFHTRPHEVLLAGGTSNGEFSALVLHD